ncbi:hypothetical protein EG835_08000, partial [bacterium]|nr:hypothetical protein [bacterium]
RNVAILYFLNSLGAVAGSALGGFFFVPMIGLSSSMTIAAAVNLALGVGVLVLSRLKVILPAAGTAEEDERPRTFSERQVTIAVAAAGVSGAASMIFEIGWVRLLIPVVGSSTYSFSLMLIAFISGITIGSWIASWIITRAKNLFTLLALCQFGVVLSLALTLPLYGRIPYAFWHLSALLDRTEATYPVFLTMEFALCLALMIVPTIFLGMNLPIASRIATRNVAVLGRSVGNVFSINTLGTVLGSLVGGLVLIPAIGVKHTIEVGLALNAGLVLLIRFHDAGSGTSRRNAWAGATLGVLAGYFMISPAWSQSVSLSGVFRLLSGTTPPPADYRTFVEQYGTKDVLFYKEGSSATVAVIGHGTGTTRQNILIVNGKPDASSRGDLPSQILIGQLPMLLHPRPHEAFVVGLGSGVTLGSVLTHDVQSVDCAEISPEVVEASAFFNEHNHRPLSDPRVTLR